MPHPKVFLKMFFREKKLLGKVPPYQAATCYGYVYIPIFDRHSNIKHSNIVQSSTLSQEESKVCPRERENGGSKSLATRVL